MTEDSLIPKDQPYGQRQKTEDAMRQAGLPTQPSTKPANLFGQFDPLTQSSPHDYPQPADQPTYQAPHQLEAKEWFTQVASTSQSSIMRRAASILSGGET